MENHCFDSSDSCCPGETLDMSYLMLDVNVLNEHLECVSNSENVETLLLYQNRLNTLPDSIQRFTNVTCLDISYCGLQRLPNFLTQMEQLVNLSAKNNGLTNDTLPKSFEGLKCLKELNLSGNGLTEFPEQVIELTGLTYLYLGGNQIAKITKEVWRAQR